MSEPNPAWCDDCHGYTHMPWCPAYRAVDEISDEEYRAESQLTEAESQLVFGAMPLQGLPDQPTRSALDECAFIHVLPSGSMRCGALREHHSQYTGHEFTEPQPASKRGKIRHIDSTCHRCFLDGYKAGKEGTWIANFAAGDATQDAEHTCGHQLAGLVPGLVEALRDILREAEFVGDAKQPFSTWIAEKCRTALTTAANHQKQ